MLTCHNVSKQKKKESQEGKSKFNRFKGKRS